MPAPRRAVGDSSRRRAPTTTSTSARVRGAGADLAMARRRALGPARASRPAPPRGGRAASRAGRAPRSSSRARRCSCRRGCATARRRPACVRCGPAQRPRQAGARSSLAVQARRPGRRRRRPARCGRCAARARGCATSTALGGQAQREAHARPAQRRRRPRRATSARVVEAVADDATPAACDRPCASTRGRRALSTAVPPAGQRLDQLALAALDGVDRAGPRQVRAAHGGHDADAGPGELRPATRMSPGTYMPISSTATWSSGARRSSVSGSPTSLFSLPLLRSTVQRVGQHLGDLLLGRRLGERAGDADDERIEAVAPRRGARRSASDGRRRRTATTVDAADGIERGQVIRRRRLARRRARPPRARGIDQEAMAVRALAGQREERVALPQRAANRPRRRGSAVARRSEAPPAARCERVGVEGERARAEHGSVSHGRPFSHLTAICCPSRRRPRRRILCRRRACRWLARSASRGGRASESARQRESGAPMARVGAGQRRQVEHGDRVERDAAEQLVGGHLEAHAPAHRHARDRVVDAHEDDRLGLVVADEADEGEVVGVGQPARRRWRPRSGPCRSCRPRRSPGWVCCGVARAARRRRGSSAGASAADSSGAMTCCGAAAAAVASSTRRRCAAGRGGRRWPSRRRRAASWSGVTATAWPNARLARSMSAATVVTAGRPRCRPTRCPARCRSAGRCRALPHVVEDGDAASVVSCPASMRDLGRGDVARVGDGVLERDRAHALVVGVVDDVDRPKHERPWSSTTVVLRSTTPARARRRR